MIPISDLMQVSHPGYRAFCIGHGMSDMQYPVFMDYCTNVCQRFRYHARQHNGTVIMENSLMEIIEAMRDMDETDEPEEIFPLRSIIRNACYDFKEHCDEMGSKFTRPDSIKQFYQRIGQLVLDVAFSYAGIENQEVIHNE